MPTSRIEKPSPTPNVNALKTSTTKNQDKITGTDVDLNTAKEMGAFWDTALTEKDVRESQEDFSANDSAQVKKDKPKGPILDI